MDVKSLRYRFAVEHGNQGIPNAINPTKLYLKDTTGNRIGNIDIKRGSIGALLDSVNHNIPNARQELEALALNLKEHINGLLGVGTSSGNLAGTDLFTGNSTQSFAINPALNANFNLLALGEDKNNGPVGVSENTIISKIADLYNGNDAFINYKQETQKLFLKSSDPTAKFSTLALNPATLYEINIKGIIEDSGQLRNAGSNNLGGDSLVQIQFFDENNVAIGAANNLIGSGPPEDTVSWSDNPPAGAAFIAVQMNNASFGDNDLTNNYGHFDIEISPSSAENDTDINIQKAYVEMVSRLNESHFNADIKAESYASVIESIELQKSSLEEVSMEEEASNLVFFQRAFSANARAFNAIDQSIQDVLRTL